jgi:leucine proline-enriched proteoglycan (leprecan)
MSVDCVEYSDVHLSLYSFPLSLPGGPLLFDDIKITMSSKQLNGSQRVLLDGFISNDECRELTRLSNVSGSQG